MSYLRPLLPLIVATAACRGSSGDDTAGGDTACEEQTWYVDKDGDGFGSDEPQTNVTSCQRPYRYRADSTDCDDAAAITNPDSVEVCDGRDNDCDGQIDEDAADEIRWYEDADGDGWGSGGYTEGCTGEAGRVGVGNDCDDENPDINPGVAEDWYDGLDNDCDGFTDRLEGTWAFTWGTGQPDATSYDCAITFTTVGYPTTDCSDCEFAFETVNTAAPESVVGDCAPYDHASADEWEFNLGFAYDGDQLMAMTWYAYSYSYYGYTYTWSYSWPIAQAARDGDHFTWWYGDMGSTYNNTSYYSGSYETYGWYGEAIAP